MDLQLSRQSQMDRQMNLSLELRDIEAVYCNFPYPLKNLTGKISFESGTAKTSGNKQLLSLCFKALKDGKSDLKFENCEILDSEKKTIEGITWYGGALWILL